MDEYERNIIPQIEAIYDTFTALEKTIADYFIHYDGKADLVSKNVMSRKPPYPGLPRNVDSPDTESFCFAISRALARHPGQAQAIISRKF